MNDGELLLEVVVFGAFWLWLLALPPAALVTALKERWLYFATGWLVFGIPWFIGALTLADPDSGWAKRFYGPERMARAIDPVRHRRPARVTATWLSGSLALLLAIGSLTVRPTLITGLDESALQYSVGRGNIGFSAQPCRHGGDRTWTCSVYDDDVSGAVPYKVKMRPWGCWVAVRSYPEKTSRGPRSGCITIWDKLRLFEVFP